MRLAVALHGNQGRGPNSGTTMTNTPQSDLEQKGAAPEAASEAAPTTGAEPGPKHPDDLIAGLRAEVADLKDKVLRAHAEVENIRKRAEREREETAKYAITRFARDVVTVGDNFQRAIDAVPPGAAVQDSALKSFLEGVTMTERELVNVLERYGIKKLAPKDEMFNPHLHQAVMEIARSDLPAGMVVQVFQAGFMIEDRVLRPAMVAVAKGGPKPAQGPAQVQDSPAAQMPPRPANDDAPPGNGTP
jgi:molecular chaperone GrpE